MRSDWLEVVATCGMIASLAALLGVVILSGQPRHAQQEAPATASPTPTPSVTPTPIDFYRFYR